MTQSEVIRLDNVSKVYGKAGAAVHALRGVSIGMKPGSFTAIMGPSGSGKSTFLHCAAGLDTPTEGRVFLGGIDLSGLSDHKLTELRRERAGFVFQAYNLVPALDVLGNITLPLRLAGKRPDRAWMDQVIDRMGLRDRVRHRPAELSGGQQQRVALARALIARPDVLFADEPTGALDSRTAGTVMRLIRQVVDELRQTVIMVTHDPVVASFADSVIILADGRVAEHLPAASPEIIAGRMVLAEVA